MKNICSSVLLWSLFPEKILPDIIVKSFVRRLPQIGAISESHIAEQLQKIVISVLHMMIGSKIHSNACPGYAFIYLIAVFDTILFLHKPFYFPIPFYFSLLGRVQIPNLPQTRQEKRTPHFCRVRSCHQCIMCGNCYLFFIKAASFYKHQSMKWNQNTSLIHQWTVQLRYYCYRKQEKQSRTFSVIHQGKQLRLHWCQMDRRHPQRDRSSILLHPA